MLLKIVPEPHLLVFGGGVDAQPLVAIAAQLGWRVTLVDARAAYARQQHFPAAHKILRQSADQLEPALLSSIDAAIVMTHNIQMDADALAAIQQSSARYTGLLGPNKRRQRVLSTANLTEDSLTKPLAGPMGLNIGGELPESIALSILAECHAVLEQRDAKSFTNLI